MDQLKCAGKYGSLVVVQKSGAGVLGCGLEENTLHFRILEAVVPSRNDRNGAFDDDRTEQNTETFPPY